MYVRRIPFSRVDFARLFPPEDPGESDPANRKMFYRMLRPEFVRFVSSFPLSFHQSSESHFCSAFHTPLSSDAFSGFRSRTRDGDANNREVREASRCLEKVNIPAVAEFLCQDISIDISSVGDICHQYGVPFLD